MTSAPRVVFATGRIASNTLRYRVRMAEELLRSRGIPTVAVHSEDPLLTSWVDSADLLVVYRAPANRRLLSAIDKARSRGIPVTFDVDDLVFLPSMLSYVPFLHSLTSKQRATMEAEARLQEVVLGLVDRCSAATTPLVEALGPASGVPCDVLPNGLSPLGADIAARTRPRDDDGRVRLGYFAGSATHDEDWALVEGAVVEIMSRYDHVDLLLVGPLRTGPALDAVAGRVRRHRPVPWQALPQLVAEVDLNLAPLAVSPFTAGKSALKWVEAAAVGTPTVATATVPFQEVVAPGVTGVLVAPGGDWVPSLEAMVLDSERRRAMAEAARCAVLEQFGPQPQAARYEDFVHAAIEGPRRVVRAEAWDVARREAPHPRGLGALLEPYPFDQATASLSVPAPAGAPLLEGARRLARRERARARQVRDSGKRLYARGRRGLRRRLGR